jgi:hypothetical protein
MSDKPKIVIGTPIFNHTVHIDHHLAMHGFAKDPSYELLDSRLFALVDLVRARSRIARIARELDCTHLWFVDADISFDPRLAKKLIDADKDIVCAAYPQKKINWDGAIKAIKDGMRPEIGAYEFPVKFKKDAVPENDLVEIEGAGTGMMMISRRCLDAMTERYADLLFTDVVNGKGTPTVALFMQMLTKEEGYPLLLGEDYSFCRRWRDMGGKIYLYIGEHAPVTHHGEHAYRWRDE